MSFQLKLAIVAAITVVIALAVLRRKPNTTLSRGHASSRSSLNPVAMWLAVVAGGLIVVGFVSGTILRHVIQIAPFVVAGGLLLRGSSLGVSAAAPLFAFWLLIMAAIWLFLLGIARIFGGTFTPAEVTLTIIIGVGSMLGLASAWRQGITTSWAAGAGVVIVFALMQFAAMLISMMPFAANR
jgi:hypothetical protein